MGLALLRENVSRHHFMCVLYWQYLIWTHNREVMSMIGMLRFTSFWNGFIWPSPAVALGSLNEIKELGSFAWQCTENPPLSSASKGEKNETSSMQCCYRGSDDVNHCRQPIHCSASTSAAGRPTDLTAWGIPAFFDWHNVRSFCLVIVVTDGCYFGYELCTAGTHLLRSEFS
jgi:hypothetical protein